MRREAATESPNVRGFLQKAREQVGALGAEFEADQARLDALYGRLQEDRCHLAVLGQFKRGKSTLVNALLGEPLLPAAVVPITSIPTFLRGGERFAARVLFAEGKPEECFVAPNGAALAEFLARFVTESANPHNQLGVRQVEATYPAPVLRQGLSLIDTPGIGSTFRHNTEATVNFLPQCDAALFVVSADPPITEVEVAFLSVARSNIARVFFVLNKVDYLDADERRAAVAFLRQVLCDRAGFAAPPRVFCVSARQGLAARQNQDDAAWQRSGMADIEHQIIEFLLTDKADVLNRAISKKADAVLADVERRVGLTVCSLRMPLAELDECIHLFEQSLINIDEQRIVALERLDKDEHRLIASVTMHADELLPKSLTFLQGLVEKCQDREDAMWTEETTREAIAAAIPSFFEGEFGAALKLCEQELREALALHRRRASDLIDSVHHLVERLFAVPFEPPQEDITLAIEDHPYWRTHKWVIKFGSIPEAWIDRTLPRGMRHARIRRRIMEQVEYLATRNVGYLRMSLIGNLKQSVQRFRDMIEDNIQHTIETTRQALDTARQQRISDSATVAPVIGRLESAIASLQATREETYK